ncbi:MAG: spore coat protein [Clostridiaceae bacterium]|nr:spore coat protein [Clostridiaceae bacterium]
MASFLGNIAKSNTDINDEVIAANMITAAKGTATAYLSAAMVSSTPELRAMCTSSLNQMVSAHAALTDLAIKRGWENPYAPSEQQLSEVYSKLKSSESQKK